MNKLKILAPVCLLVFLVLLGAGCQKSPESFYKKVCKISIDFQEAAEDIFEDGGYGEAMLGEEYDDLDDCIDEMVEAEEDIYDDCMDEEDDEEVCAEAIDHYRKMITNVFTKQGCSALFTFQCGMYGGEAIGEDFNECMRNVDELCGGLPASF
jgi:hypothetical protein